MQLTGEQAIAAPRERVWEALNDPAVLRECLPGCRSLAKNGDCFDAVLEIKVGPIGARFNGSVELTELDPPSGYVIVGEGRGGMAGNAKGRARVTLEEQGGRTLLKYAVDAEIGGRLAQLGGAVIEATARQLAAKFFACFEQKVTGAGGDTAEAAAATAAPSGAGAGTVPHAAASSALAGGAATAPHTVSPTAIDRSDPVGDAPWGWFAVLALAILAGFLLGRSAAADWWVVAVILLVLAASAAGYRAGRGR